MAVKKAHWEAVAPGVREAYELLSGLLHEDPFYLAGGTALALMEGHRISLDLDFFAPDIGNPESLTERILAKTESAVIVSVAHQTLYITVSGISVSFIGSSYPLISAPEIVAPGLIPLACRDDLAAMKLAAIASRGSRKDFVDLWVLIKKHKVLADYLAVYQSKYGANDPGHLLRSLIYFDDAEREEPLRLLIDLDWEEVKRDFEVWVLPLVQ